MRLKKIKAVLSEPLQKLSESPYLFTERYFLNNKKPKAIFSYEA